MFPAFLIRAGIDAVRHDKQFVDSNPYSRCEESIKICAKLWEEQIGKVDLAWLTPTVVSAYWAEFFHAEDTTSDEKDWRDGLIKRSGSYDHFDNWCEWFKQSYAKVYQENPIWTGVLMTAWAHTHQYEVLYTAKAWEFRPALPYLTTTEMWRMENHLSKAASIIDQLWRSEVEQWTHLGFTVEESANAYVGKVECLGFDTRSYSMVWPPQAQRDKVPLELGEIVADIVAPPTENWYRAADNVIFGDDHMDITALVNRTRYMFGSRRRFLELIVNKGMDKAKLQSLAEGWLAVELTDALR